MLRKFVSSILAVFLFCGCSPAEPKSVHETPSGSAKDIALRLMKKLDMTDSMQEVKGRVVKGMLFYGEDVVSDASVYFSKEDGNSDAVGVFVAEDLDKAREYIGSYLEEQKQNTQVYYPEEVFKISNAVLKDNGSMMILIVCSDIEDAKNAAEEYLNN